MKVKLDYGRDGLEIEVPNPAEVLQMAPSEGTRPDRGAD